MAKKPALLFYWIACSVHGVENVPPFQVERRFCCAHLVPKDSYEFLMCFSVGKDLFIQRYTHRLNCIRYHQLLLQGSSGMIFPIEDGPISVFSVLLQLVAPQPKQLRHGVTSSPFKMTGAASRHDGQAGGSLIYHS